MKSSCIDHPKKERLIIIRAWQVAFCDGNTCAAALLSFFEYWHNIKLDKRADAAHSRNKNDLPETQDRDLWQFHTEEQLTKGIMLYGRSSIAAAIALLKRKGVIEVGRNPNPRYRFDRTRHFLFKPEVAKAFLKTWSDENSALSAENSSPKAGSAGTIPETTVKKRQFRDSYRNYYACGDGGVAAGVFVSADKQEKSQAGYY